ncbi:MAG: efflux RND transporter periplasmic adaptor subunit [Chitinophagaceae bacterium]|nr:efflux RND transporter periplasmic adaptor subunit [Chitinophagaceae bacterium]
MKKYSSLILLILLLASCSQNKNEEPKKDIKNETPVYQTAQVEQAGLKSSFKLPAQLAAFEEVNIFPKLNAYVKTVKVDIGNIVKKGSLLVELEAPELDQALLASKEKYLRTQSDLRIDTEHYLRLMDASKTSGAISPYDLSSAKAKVISDSILSNAEKANWDMQKSMLDYLQVRAPFDGMITERNIHPGALVNASAKDKAMLQLKQIGHLRLQVDVPEALAAELHEKDSIQFFTSAFPGKKNIGLISRKSHDINPQFRTERIEIDVWNTDNSLLPGMYADLIVESKGNATAFIVPKSAVVSSTERKYVILIRNGLKQKVDVITRNENMDKTEVFGLLNKGDTVIIHASDEIK